MNETQLKTDGIEDQSLQTKKTNNWLQRLKDESWEAELLVSAIAIFGTFQLFNVINWTTNKFINYLPEEQHIIGYFIVFTGLLAVSILVSMFVIHFLLRAYWIGLVGLNSVFPDYSLDDSAYSEVYTKKILSILPKLKDSLQKVDELCSVIFSAAFCILLIYAYLSISASIYLFLFNFLSDFIPPYILFIPIAIIVIIIILQTIINMIANLKRFKQNESLQLWYFKIVKLASILMFGPLYKHLLQITMTFASNFKRKKSLIGFLFLFLCSGIFVAGYQVANTNILYLMNKNHFFDASKTYSGFYKTENENIDFLLTPEIESDIIQTEIMKLYIPVFSHEEIIKEENCPPFESDPNLSRSENTLKRKIQSLTCYHQYHQVLLNGVKILPEYLKYYHPRTEQFGIVTYIKLTTAKEGKNVLEVKKMLNKEAVSEWSIPFQYIAKKF